MNTEPTNEVSDKNEALQGTDLEQTGGEPHYKVGLTLNGGVQAESRNASRGSCRGCGAKDELSNDAQ